MLRVANFRSFLVLGLIVGMAIATTAQDAVHAVGGTVTKLGSASKTFAVKTAEGTEESFKYSDKTVVETSKDAAQGARVAGVDSYMAGRKGSHVVVRYTGEGADRTAVGVKDLGKDTLKVSKGTIASVGEGSRVVAIKTDEGTVETFRISKSAVVDTDHGVVKASEYSAKEGERVTVQYTEEAGLKVAHLFKHI
jgi:hypothetical protein